MNIGTHMAKHADKAVIAILNVDGTYGEIRAKTRKGWNLDVDLFIKVGSEKPSRIATVSDNMAVDALIEYLDEVIETSFVTEWKV